MSDILSDYDDILAENFFEELEKERLFKETALQQCIYLFVEGESEEKAFPVLLQKTGIDFDDIGLVIANYNGNGNVIHCLRLMRRTLSHDRPIIITIDNDPNGSSIMNRYYEKKVDKDYIFFIPQEPKVTFTNGHRGGSYEEIFPVSFFIDTCFSDDVMHENLLKKRHLFVKDFDANKPWFAQIMKFCNDSGFPIISSKKVELAIKLAQQCEEIPSEIEQLADLIKEVREKYPLRF